MSMFNDIVWDAKGNEEICENNSKKLKNTLKDSLRSLVFPWTWFRGPGSEKKWYATYNGRPNGCWDQTVEKMMHIFQRSGHPISMRDFHACEKQKVLVRAIVEGDLFRSARSSFFFLSFHQERKK